MVAEQHERGVLDLPERGAGEHERGSAAVDLLPDLARLLPVAIKVFERERELSVDLAALVVALVERVLGQLVGEVEPGALERVAAVLGHQKTRGGVEVGAALLEVLLEAGEALEALVHRHVRRIVQRGGAEEIAEVLRVADLRVPDLAVVQQTGEVDVALREPLVLERDAPQPEARDRAPDAEVGLVEQVEAQAPDRLERGARLVEPARLAGELVELDHQVGVEPVDVGLAEALVAAGLGDDREVVELVEDRPAVLEVVRRADPEADRAEQQLARLLVAVEREAGEVDQRVVEIPGVDLLGVLVAFEPGEEAAQRLALRVVELPETLAQLCLERHRLAAPLAVAVQRGDHGQLDHVVGHFAGDVGHDVAEAAMMHGRAPLAGEVGERALGAPRPVAVVHRRQVERGVGGPEHLHELARHLLLGVAGPVAEHEDRVGQHDVFARGELAAVRLVLRGRGRGEVAELGPVAADHAVGLGPGELEVAVERSEVLEIEHAAEGRAVEAEVDEAAVDPALRRFDVAAGGERVVAAAERVEVAREERHAQVPRRAQAGADPQPVEPVAGGRYRDRMAAERAVDLEPKRFAGLRCELAAFEAGHRDVGRPQGERALAGAADEHPDRVPPGADLEFEITERRRGERAQRTRTQLLAQRDRERARFGVIDRRGLVHNRSLPETLGTARAGDGSGLARLGAGLFRERPMAARPCATLPFQLHQTLRIFGIAKLPLQM